MNGVERIRKVFARDPAGRPPVLPMMHTALARVFGVKLGDFFTRADRMAEVMARGYREFGFDGVGLSLGVTAEAEALGADVGRALDAVRELAEGLIDRPGVRVAGDQGIGEAADEERDDGDAKVAAEAGDEVVAVYTHRDDPAGPTPRRGTAGAAGASNPADR